MVLCARDVSAGAELMQVELFSGDEPECPGYDLCPVGACGCRWLGLGTPWRETGKNISDTALHGNDDDLLLTHRKAITPNKADKGKQNEQAQS